MPDARASNIPLNFDALTKKQKIFVRTLAWKALKAEAPFVVVIPSATGFLGAIIGIVLGAVLGHVLFSEHHTICRLASMVVGIGVGAWIGWMWLQRECQTRFKNVIREHGDEISQIV